MKRYEFERAVYESALDKIEKQVLVYYAYRKNWVNGGLVWVSAATVSKETGLSSSSVARRTVRLREAGWLLPTGGTHGGGAVEYDLAIGTSPTEVTSVSQTHAHVGGTEASVSEHAASVSGADKEVKNNREEEEEEVKSVAVAPETASSIRRDERDKFNSSNASMLRTRSVRIVREIGHERRVARELLESMIRIAGLTPEETFLAHSHYESPEFDNRSSDWTKRADRAVKAARAFQPKKASGDETEW